MTSEKRNQTQEKEFCIPGNHSFLIITQTWVGAKQSQRDRLKSKET